MSDNLGASGSSFCDKPGKDWPPTRQQMGEMFHALGLILWTGKTLSDAFEQCAKFFPESETMRYVLGDLKHSVVDDRLDFATAAADLNVDGISACDFSDEICNLLEGAKRVRNIPLACSHIAYLHDSVTGEFFKRIGSSDPDNVCLFTKILASSVSFELSALRALRVAENAIKTQRNLRSNVALSRELSMADYEAKLEQQRLVSWPREVISEIERGATFHEALQKCGSIFGELCLDVIQYGESGGRPDKALGLLAGFPMSDLPCPPDLSGEGNDIRTSPGSGNSGQQSGFFVTKIGERRGRR